MKLSALVVDDEPIARHAVVRLLREDPDIAVAGECGDGVSAVAAIRDLSPDLVFLDIQMPAITGLDVDYEFVARALWIDSPATGVKQVFALLVIWAHGCLGLHFWLRYRDWYPAASPFLLIGAVLVPVLGLLGFAEAGKVVLAQPTPPTPDAVMAERLAAVYLTKTAFLNLAYAVALGAVAATLALRGLRQAIARRNLIEVRYESGQVVRVPKGSSVLEASRIGGIPHYAVCGGRGLWRRRRK